MLVNATLEKLKNLKLSGMALAYEEQRATPDVHSISFDDRLGLIVDREETVRYDRRFQKRMKSARLREQACLEDIDYGAKRSLEKSIVLSLAACDWIKGHQNVIITGPTGIGKTYLSCALLHKACKEGFTARHVRLPRLVHDIAVARADGSYNAAMAGYAKIDVMLFDDWGLAALTNEEARDILELLDDRNGRRSSIITSQLPPEKWYELIADPTLADAIMDRIIHRSHKIALKGPSMRRPAKPIDYQAEVK